MTAAAGHTQWRGPATGAGEAFTAGASPCTPSTAVDAKSDTSRFIVVVVQKIQLILKLLSPSSQQSQNPETVGTITAGKSGAQRVQERSVRGHGINARIEGGEDAISGGLFPAIAVSPGTFGGSHRAGKNRRSSHGEKSGSGVGSLYSDASQNPNNHFSLVTRHYSRRTESTAPTPAAFAPLTQPAWNRPFLYPTRVSGPQCAIICHYLALEKAKKPRKKRGIFGRKSVNHSVNT